MEYNMKNKFESIKDKLIYSYIRKIKRWMYCPACQNGKMSINNKSTLWTCEDCGYKLSAYEFENGYIFWFCDECNTYLNNQEGFKNNAIKHICTNCGYENDTTNNNVKGICTDCGKVIPDLEGTLCVECKQVRKQKAKEWLKNAGKLIGAVTLVAGGSYIASQISNEENDSLEYSSNTDFDDMNNETDILHNNVDGIIETEYCQGCIHHYVYPINGVTHEVCNIYGRDGCYSGCNRKETSPRFRWTDANRWDND